MIRVVRACSVVGILLVAASDGRAAPKAKPNERSPSPAAGLESADPAVRRDAINRLVTDRDPTAVAQLSLAVEGDDDESVRQAAASGLGELADKRGVGALKRCLQRESSEAVKRSCRVSLARLDPAAATMSSEPTGTSPAAGRVRPAATPARPAVTPGAPAATPGAQAATPAAPAATPGGPAATPGGPAATPGAPAATPGAPAATPAAPAASPQLDLRIDLTAQEVAARPNHVYLELWSAIDQNTLALGYERVVDPRWSVALESRFFAQSLSFAGASSSAVSASLAVRPHFYFLQQAPSGPYVAPFGSIGYSRTTLMFDAPPGFPPTDNKTTGTVWAVGAGVGWSLVVNARAVFKLSVVFSYAKAAATLGGSLGTPGGTPSLQVSSSAATFNPFLSAGIML